MPRPGGALGLDADQDLQIYADFKDEGGYHAVGVLLEMEEPPDAIFVTNNRMTTGALHALMEYKISIPDDVSLVGFDVFWLWPTILFDPELIVRGSSVKARTVRPPLKQKTV